MFLLEKICNQLPSIHADIPWEQTPPTVTVGGPMDLLPQISQQKGAVEAACQTILLLFVTSINASLPGPALCQRIPQQAYVYTSLPEV